MVELPHYLLKGPNGPVRVADVFEGRSQLITYSHMWSEATERSATRWSRIPQQSASSEPTSMPRQAAVSGSNNMHRRLRSGSRKRIHAFHTHEFREVRICRAHRRAVPLRSGEKACIVDCVEKEVRVNDHASSASRTSPMLETSTWMPICLVRCLNAVRELVLRVVTAIPRRANSLIAAPIFRPCSRHIRSASANTSSSSVTVTLMHPLNHLDAQLAMLGCSPRAEQPPFEQGRTMTESSSTTRSPPSSSSSVENFWHTSSA